MVATSLALSLADSHRVIFVDCDVEAPNGHLFLRPEFSWSSDAVILLPEIQTEICTACGRCVEVCQFHALAQIGRNILVFPQLCHGCGTCTWNCPAGAIIEKPHPIGRLEGGETQEGIGFLRGLLTVSEPMPTPIIRQLKRRVEERRDQVVIYDAPPGASCSVVETLRACDYVILVGEPSPFGQHDLRQMLGIVKEFGMPAGVVINRDNDTYAELDDLCAQNNLPVLMRIAYDRGIAEGLASGEPLVEFYPHFRQHLLALFDKISTQSAQPAHP